MSPKLKAFAPELTPPTEIGLSDNSRQVLHKRYLRRGLDGKPAETIEGMFRRVARAVAEPDGSYGYDAATTEESFYALLTSLRFFPNSPTFTGAGTPLGQLAACFVLPISDDMGRRSDGIFQTLRDAALIQQTGGGNGFSFSRLRPKGDSVASSAGVATGPVGFLQVYDIAFGEVAQGGTRRGANMAVLQVDHPDIEQFVSCKEKEGQISNFNISVGITDAFMQAVEADADFPLVNPRDGQVWRTVRARDLFDKIVTYAHHNGEPGALFLDAANRSNPVPHLYELAATNPCFVGSTRVATDQGFLTMADLYRLQKPLYVATDERAAPEWVRGGSLRAATPVSLTHHDAPVMTLRTRHGYTVTATPDHRFLTPDRGYVPLGGLQPGDRLLIQSSEGPWAQNYELPNLSHVREKLAVLGHGGDHASGRTTTRRDFSAQYASVPTLWSYDLGVAVGWLVGDGWLSPTSNSPDGPRVRNGRSRLLWGGNPATYPPALVWPRSSTRTRHRSTTDVRPTSLRVFCIPGRHCPHQQPRSAFRQAFGAPHEMQCVASFRAYSAPTGQCKSTKRSEIARSGWPAPRKICCRRSNCCSPTSESYPASTDAGIAPFAPCPMARGGSRNTLSAPQYDLVIGKVNRVKFAETIGFAHPLKQARLLEHIAGSTRGAYR